MTDSTETLQIGPRRIGPGNRPFIIAEIGQAHEGSLGIAESYVEAVADAGVDAVKFQTHIASAESTRDEPWRTKFSKQDNTRYDYWERMEFSPDEWNILKDTADEKGIVFLSSPFSKTAVDLLMDVGVPAWKVASGETNNYILLDRMIETDLPLLVSTGMSTFNEIDRVVRHIRNGNSPCALFQCTSSYPCPPEEVGLNLIQEMKDRYNCPVGLSDHTGNIYSSLAATALNANLIEVHVTFSKKMFGPDVPVSLTIEELEQMVNGVHSISKMINHPVDKNQVAEEMAEMRGLFNKSIVATRSLEKGYTLKESDITVKKPGTGLGTELYDEVIGLTLNQSVEEDEILTEDHFSETLS